MRGNKGNDCYNRYKIAFLSFIILQLLREHFTEIDGKS